MFPYTWLFHVFTLWWWWLYSPIVYAAAPILTVLHEKLNKLLSGDDIKPIQKIVIALGHICVKESSSSHLKIALDLIFSLSRSKVGGISSWLLFWKFCYLSTIYIARFYILGNIQIFLPKLTLYFLTDHILGNPLVVHSMTVNGLPMCT